MSTSQRLTYCLLLTLGASSLGAFLFWWFQPGNLPDNFEGSWHVLDIALFATLSLVLLHRPFMDVFTWIVSWSIQNDRAPEPQEGLRVAFLTTFVPGSEPLELLHQALPAMVGADYPHDVWVLDEGGGDDVRAVCESYGVHYFTRKGRPEYNQEDGRFAAKTKGGNHNAWCEEHGDDYDVVAQIDTDFIPRRDFLTRTLGFFRDPRLAWVGTPQVYGNGGESIVARGASQQLYMFYGAILRGLSGRSSANMIGANHVVRVSALRTIDFYAGHLTEDLLTGMQLHARGWTSRYISTPLAVGQGPVTWQAFFAQQLRWAHGCVDILLRHSPKLFRTMGRRQAALYAALQQHYFGGLAMAAGVGLLVLYFFGGIYAANVSLFDVILWAGPQLLVRQLILLWLQRFQPTPGDERGLLMSGRLVSVVVWPVYLMAAIGAIRGKRLTFKVTPKGAQDVRYIPPAIARPHLVIGGISLACVMAGLTLGHTSIPLLFWASVNVITMLGFAGYVSVNNARPQFSALRRRVLPARVVAVAPLAPVSANLGLRPLGKHALVNRPADGRVHDYDPTAEAEAVLAANR